MAERRSHGWRYPIEIHRRRVPNVAMGNKPWLPEGEKAPAVKTYSKEEIAASVAARPDLKR